MYVIWLKTKRIQGGQKINFEREKIHPKKKEKTHSRLLAD